MSKKTFNQVTSRRKFISRAGLGAASLALLPDVGFVSERKTSIQETKKPSDDQNASKKWIPVSDRKIRVGLIGYGYSRFSAAFGFQDHPNVEVVAVSDLIPDRCGRVGESNQV